MARQKHYRSGFQLLLAVLSLACSLGARELPVRSFTTADGLGDNRVRRIVTDSRGLLWICTSAGLSRFDGAHFQNFGVAQGLPFPSLNDLIETPEGDFWLASNGGGVIRFSLSSATRRFEAFSVSSAPTSNRVNRLLRTPDGTIWAGTDGGLFRMTVGVNGQPVFTRVELRQRDHPNEMVQVWAMLRDPEGSLWVGTRFGLVRILPRGGIVSYAIRAGSETDNVYSLMHAPEDGLLWIGHQAGLAVFKPPPAPSYERLSQPAEDSTIARASAGRPRKILGASAALPQEPWTAAYFDSPLDATGAPLSVADLARSPSGAIHIVARGALLSYSNGRFSVVGDQRLKGFLRSATEDREGNLWLAVQVGGVLRLARHGFVTFGVSDGLGQSIGALFEDRVGDLIVFSEGWLVSRFEGWGFRTVRANVPAAVRRSGWSGNMGILQDRTGDWWFATAAGLVRFSGVRRIEDLATMVPRLYTRRDGLAQDSVRRLHEDLRGDIWISGLITGRAVLTRWDRASGRFHTYSDADGLPAFNSPSSFYEDPQGVLWIAFRDGGLARYQGGRFRLLTEAQGLPPGSIGTALGDRAGKLWFSNPLGLFRIDDLNVASLQPVLVADAKEFRGGGASNIIQDARGNIYAVTGQGIFRFDAPAATSGSGPAGIAALYTRNDGLAAGEVRVAYADPQGRLWFATTHGLSFYQPEGREELAPPPAPLVRIGGLRVAGVDRPISPAGEASLSGLELFPGQSQLEIDFFGISFATGEALSYEYRLLGASEQWSSPSPLRTVLFSNLAPGAYEFEVRTVSVSGARSAQPARVVFRVLAPFWQSWWFVTLVALVVLGGVGALERNRSAHRREINRAREQRLAELEQVRQQIAADLHDEIGSTLTQISILSEVALRQGAESTPVLRHPLSTIATSSRELVDAMSDIVWAINPAKDHLSDLTQRIRRLAGDTFAAGSATVRLELPPRDVEVKLAAPLRRDVFLIFKEGINNIVKHSGCSEAVIRLGIQGSLLRLELSDNGKGFDLSQPVEGHGLTSLRRRAKALGGTLTVISTPGEGTAITLELPLSQQFST